MAGRRITTNRDLTRSDYVLSPDRPHRNAARWAFAVLAALVLLGAGVSYFESHLKPALFLSDTRAENAELQAQVGRLRLELEVELATRGELERQVAELRQQLAKANEELAFLKSAGAKPAGR